MLEVLCFATLPLSPFSVDESNDNGKYAAIRGIVLSVFLSDVALADCFALTSYCLPMLDFREGGCSDEGLADFNEDLRLSPDGGKGSRATVSFSNLMTSGCMEDRGEVPFRRTITELFRASRSTSSESDSPESLSGPMKKVLSPGEVDKFSCDTCLDRVTTRAFMLKLTTLEFLDIVTGSSGMGLMIRCVSVSSPGDSASESLPTPDAWITPRRASDSIRTSLMKLSVLLSGFRGPLDGDCTADWLTPSEWSSCVDLDFAATADLAVCGCILSPPAEGVLLARPGNELVATDGN
jgi:hypothetical protein